jgi:hypothetical protein
LRLENCDVECLERVEPNFEWANVASNFFFALGEREGLREALAELYGAVIARRSPWAESQIEIQFSGGALHALGERLTPRAKLLAQHGMARGESASEQACGDWGGDGQELKETVKS